jgi:hypothetical protein
MPAPHTTFLVHGEPPAARGMAEYLATTRGWAVEVPTIGQSFRLSPPAS